MDPPQQAPAPAVPKKKGKAKAKGKAKTKAKPPADVAKKPAPPASAEPKGDTGSEGAARVVEAIQRDARLRVAVQRHTYSVQCKLLEGVDEDYLNWNARYLTPENYSDTTLERGLEGRCGFPTCSNAVVKEEQASSARFHISTKTKQVYELQDRAYFCSDRCTIASQQVKEQLSDEAVHLRPHVIAEYDERSGQILPKAMEPKKEQKGPFGSLSIHENPAPAPPSTEFSGTFAVEGYTPSLEMSNAPVSISRSAPHSSALPAASKGATPKKTTAAEPLPDVKADTKAAQKRDKQKLALQLNLFGELWTVLARWCTSRTISFLNPDFDPWKDREDQKKLASQAAPPKPAGGEQTEAIEPTPVILRPAVDSEEPEVVRARLMMDMLARYLPLLYSELGINFVVEQELRDLCGTFDFYHPVDLSKPAHCAIYGLVLIEALTSRREALARVMHANNSAKVQALASQYNLTAEEFAGLVAIFRPPPGFVPPPAETKKTP